jgi:two-component system LytT family response regulator
MQHRPECHGIGPAAGARAIAAIDPWVNDGYLIKLRDGAEVEVSRRQARELRERLAL